MQVSRAERLVRLHALLAQCAGSAPTLKVPDLKAILEEEFAQTCFGKHATVKGKKEDFVTKLKELAETERDALNAIAGGVGANPLPAVAVLATATAPAVQAVPALPAGTAPPTVTAVPTGAAVVAFTATTAVPAVGAVGAATAVPAVPAVPAVAAALLPKNFESITIDFPSVKGLELGDLKPIASPFALELEPTDANVRGKVLVGCKLLMRWRAKPKEGLSGWLVGRIIRRCADMDNAIEGAIVNFEVEWHDGTAEHALYLDKYVTDCAKSKLTEWALLG